MANNAPPIPSWQGSRDQKGGVSSALWSWMQSLGDFVNGQASAAATQATAPDYQGDAAGFKALTPETVWDAAAAVTLTDAATIAIDMSAGFNFTVTIAGNRTLGNPTNAKVGQSGCIEVVCAGTNTIGKGSNWYSSDALTWPLSISGSVANIFYFVKDSTTILVTGVIGPNFN